MPSGIGILWSSLALRMSMTSMPPMSAANNHLPSSDSASPFGPSRPEIHSAAMILPSSPTFAMEPLPSASHAWPSMFDTYSTLRFASNRTDSGTLSSAADSQSFVSLWPSACAPAATSRAPNAATIFFMVHIPRGRGGEHRRGALYLRHARPVAVSDTHPHTENLAWRV